MVFSDTINGFLHSNATLFAIFEFNIPALRSQLFNAVLPFSKQV